MNTILTEKKKKRKKKKKVCFCGGWAFAPFYGPLGGPSGATHPPFQPTLQKAPSYSQSPGIAYPGAGGKNMPGVPGGGANSGAGPVHAEKEVSMSLEQLNEGLEFLSRGLSSLSSPGIEQEQDNLVDYLVGSVEDAFISSVRDLEDELTAEQMMQLTNCTIEMNNHLLLLLQARCPWVFEKKVPLAVDDMGFVGPGPCPYGSGRGRMGGEGV